METISITEMLPRNWVCNINKLNVKSRISAYFCLFFSLLRGGYGDNLKSLHAHCFKLL